MPPLILQVTPAVVTLWFTINTKSPSTFALLPNIPKMIDQQLLSANTYRLLIYSPTDTSSFSGNFMTVSADYWTFSNIIGTDALGNNVSGILISVVSFESFWLQEACW